jgi:hypothetical protein
MRKCFFFFCFFCSSFLKAQTSNASRAATSKVFNPDISVNFLGLYQNHDKGGFDSDGLSLQEAELQFMSDIDPYWRASALFSVAKEGSDWKFEPEEVFAETTALPYVSLKAGKFKAAFGKHNILHTHTFPFIDAPEVNTLLLGEEGLNEAGISASVLFPHVPWFMEWTLQVLKGDSEVLFKSDSSKDFAEVLHLKNLFDLSDSTTLEFGASTALGANSLNGNTSAFGGDLTLKYRPSSGGKYRSIVWAVEYLNLNRSMFLELAKVDGFSTWTLYQFAERWNAGLRYDLVGAFQKKETPHIQKGSVIIGFNFSEFSGLRAQYDYSDRGLGEKVHHFGLQLNMTMGAHPAHAY